MGLLCPACANVGLTRFELLGRKQLFCWLLIWGREDKKYHSLSAWLPTFFKLSLTYSYSFGARVPLLLRGTKGLVHNLQPRWGSSR